MELESPEEFFLSKGYQHVLSHGYAVVHLNEGIEVWRREMRRRARLDNLHIRTIISKYEGFATAVLIERRLTPHHLDTLLRVCGVHVCYFAAPPKLHYANTNFCPDCGEELKPS